ncbi:MAG: hypothetical protein WKG01_18645 [Kofleriaceae bacterium]
MKPSRHLWILVGLSAAACGAKRPEASRIVDGSDLELADCAVLEKVSGTASTSDPDAETHAKAAARRRAAELGATHVKWMVPCCTYVEGTAYRCDAPE